MENNKPVLKIRSGAIAASIWRHDGQNGPFYSADVQRCYKDRDDKWAYTSSFSRDEIPVAEKLMGMAFGAILRMEAKDREESQDSPRHQKQAQRPAAKQKQPKANNSQEPDRDDEPTA